MEKQWYEIEYENKPYLHNKVLIFQKFDSRWGSHRHCELCWERFSQVEGDLHEGYYEENSESWICPKCKTQYINLFGWKIDKH